MEKLERLRTLLKGLDKGIVAFSGGCDSTFLLQVAHEVMGDKVIALTAISPSMAPWEREDAKKLAEWIGAQHIWVESHEMDREEYRANPSNRCFFCKDELFSIAQKEGVKLNMGVVMDGANVDDRGDHRPGRLAAEKYNVRSPLDEVGLTKQEIRDLSKQMGLPTWDKPAIACLASRFPYGTRISTDRINRITACEQILRELGMIQFRARFHDTILRIEIDPVEFDKVMQANIREEIVKRCKEQGFQYIALDLQGYRSGSLNEVLASEEKEAATSSAPSAH